MFKDSSNQAEFELLIRATRHELFHFIIVQYQHLALVNTVKNDLKAKYPERPFAEFNIENINPDTFIHSILACKTGFVFIEKFELFFQEDLQALAIGFNQRRDLFSTLPIQLIVFVPFGGNILQHFQQTMPDFYSILNLSISLKSEILPEQNQLKIAENDSNDTYESIVEAKQEIERIENRLNTIQSTIENALLKRELISQLANAYRFCADYLKSKELYEQLLVELEQENIPNIVTEVTITQNNLALVLKDLGDYANAKKLLEKVVDSAEKNFGTDHYNTAITYSNLASTLQDLGDYSGAKDLFEKALRSDEKNFGIAHPSTAITYSNLGLVYKDLGDYARAKGLLEKALISYEQSFGESHPTTAITYSNLGLVYKDLGDYTGAKVLFEKALISAEQNFGESHPTTAIRYSNLALVLKDLGDYTVAKVLLEKALISAEQNFGESHPTTAIRYSNLASVLSDLGDYARAKYLLGKAYRILLNHLGEQHPNTKIVKANLDSLKQKLT